MPNTKAPDHKIYYANALNLGFSNTDCKITFGIADDVQVGAMMETATVYMTHTNLKVLSESLKLLVENFETTSGTTIPISEEGLKAFKEALKTFPNSVPIS